MAQLKDQFTLQRDWLYEVLGFKRQTHVDTAVHAVCRTQGTRGTFRRNPQPWFVLYEIRDNLYRSGHSFRTESEGSREAEAEGAESKFQSYRNCLSEPGFICFFKPQSELYLHDNGF